MTLEPRNCRECQQPFTPKRRTQDFCKQACRSAWHRRDSLPGVVEGLRQLKGGKCKVTVCYPQLPDGVAVGAAVRLELD